VTGDANINRQERIRRIKELHRRSTRYYRVSSAVISLAPLLMIFGLYEIIRAISIGNRPAIVIGFSLVLAGFLIHAGSKVILVPLWNKLLAELESELEEAEAEIKTSL
jgi:hypothetical protein